MNKMSLTYEQVAYIVEQTGISDPKQAIEYFAEIMKKEGIRPKMMPQVVEKLMNKRRRSK
jgi:hypothetical protein